MTEATAGVLSTLFIHFVAITSQCISDKKAKDIVRGDGRDMQLRYASSIGHDYSSPKYAKNILPWNSHSRIGKNK